MDVGGWLRGLGLGQYEEKFRDNKIDADLLPRLTVDDLKDIGVSVVGDRRRLLDAIALIAGAGRPADLAASQTKSAPRGAGHLPSVVRPGDVLRSRRLDEPARSWTPGLAQPVSLHLDQASAALTDPAAMLKKLGDGLMALFGYRAGGDQRRLNAIQRALSDPLPRHIAARQTPAHGLGRAGRRGSQRWCSAARRTSQPVQAAANPARALPP
jgi:hypothetical protein